MQNPKTVAGIYSDIDSVSDLEKQLKTKSVNAKDTRQNLRSIEQDLKKLREIIKYAKQY